MIKRSVHNASYSIYRIRGAMLLCVMAAVGVGVGAVMAAANMVVIGALDIGGFRSGEATTSDALIALAVTLAMAALATFVSIALSDRCAPLMRRTRDEDRLNSRWGLRWVSVSFALVPFFFVAVVLALFALGFDVSA